MVSSEVVPFVKTGGLADVTGALVNEYKKTGVDTLVILPLYKKIRENLKKLGIKPLKKEITVPLGNSIEHGKLWKGNTSGGADVYFIENDKFYNRDELYGTPAGDYPDNASRFIFYSRGALETLKELRLTVDIIHCNDWQTGLIPVYLKTIYKNDFPQTATLITIHNIGYQGIFDHIEMLLTGFGWEMFHMDALEVYGKINFLKAGILFSDLLTTVSNTYAREIMTSEYGFGLDTVLKKRSNDLYGIINGIDYKDWNPEKDNLIAAKYSRYNLSGKATCKKSLLKTCGLPETNSLLIGIVARLTSHKGFVLVAKAMDEIIKSGAQVVILGKGDEYFQKIFLNLKQKYIGRLSVTIGFDDILAHKIYAGSDIFLMPSKYEPCGLGQLIALRYGTIPAVRRTGGLADTIIEYNPSKGTGAGFLFNDYSYTDIVRTVKRADKLFNDKKHWQKIMDNAISQDFSWRQSAKQYLSLYEKILKAKKVTT